MSAPPIRARYYDGRSARAHEITLALSGTAAQARLQLNGEGIDLPLPLTHVRIGERVGRTPRLIALPGDGSLEVLDNDAFDAELQRAGLRTAEQGVRRLENRWRYALAALVGTAAVVGLFLAFGLPALATRALAYIPPRVDSYIGEDTLRMLDRTTFQASALAPERQARLRTEFAAITGGFHWRGNTPALVFRRGGGIGANAIALPSGVVVLTDEMVAQTKDDDELRGVLAHEVGHVMYRHAMRMLVQSSASTLLLAGVFGDVSGAAPLTAAAPAVLVNSAYSRDFERQADDFAFSWMEGQRIDPARLGALLERLSGKAGEHQGFLASHPDLEERVRAAHAHHLRQPAP